MRVNWKAVQTRGVEAKNPPNPIYLPTNPPCGTPVGFGKSGVGFGVLVMCRSCVVSVRTIYDH